MNDIKQLHQLAQNAINQREFVQAHEYCVRVIKLQPDHADAYFLLGIVNSEVGQFNKAIKLIDKAISLQPNVEYYAHLAKCCSLVGDMTRALQAAYQAPVSKIDQSLTLDTVGVALSRIGEHELALEYFTKVLSTESKNPMFYYNYAVSSKFAGRFKQAQEAFNRAIELMPDYYQAHFALSDLGGITLDNNHIQRLEKLLNDNAPCDSALHLGHALAKEYEAIGRHSAAFETLKKAKSKKLLTINYQFSEDKKLFDAVMQSQGDAQTNSIGCGSSKPIFVLGMPRSGTTLVERILSNHNDVRSCGELQDFGVAVKELTKTASKKVLDVETLMASEKLDYKALGERYIERTAQISGSEKHFVDKLPFNFFYIGLIRKALPNAKIVCLMRNPMDTCIGNYRQLFSINSPHYAYAYDLLNIGRFYAEFYRLAHYWQDSGLENFKLLDYQQLVTEPELQIRQLIDFCDLDWQAQCLHAEKNSAPVSTASKVQVREPINAKSIGRWKMFQPHTNELERFFTEQDIQIG
jgi:tetratricopeptide (TPR) repeat protein